MPLIDMIVSFLVTFLWDNKLFAHFVELSINFVSFMNKVFKCVPMCNKPCKEEPTLELMCLYEYLSDNQNLNSKNYSR